MKPIYKFFALATALVLLTGCTQFNPDNTMVGFKGKDAYLIPSGAYWGPEKKRPEAEYSFCKEGEAIWSSPAYHDDEVAFMNSKTEVINYCTARASEAKKNGIELLGCDKKLNMPKVLEANPYDYYCAWRGAFTQGNYNKCAKELYKFDEWNGLKLKEEKLKGCSSPMSDREYEYVTGKQK